MSWASEQVQRIRFSHPSHSGNMVDVERLNMFLKVFSSSRYTLVLIIPTTKINVYDCALYPPFSPHHHNLIFPTYILKSLLPHARPTFSLVIEAGESSQPSVPDRP